MDTVEEYDPNIDAWKPMNPKPTAVSDVNAVVIGGKIYVPGGKAASGKPIDRLEIYDPGEDVWIEGPSMPEPLSAYAAASFEGKLYLFGGWDGQQFVNTVYEYDPTQEFWQVRTPMPTRRGFSGAAVSGGKVHVIGGFDGVRALSTNEVYFPERDNGQDNPWSMARSMPAGRYAMGIAPVADIIHIVGGMGQVKESQQTLVYFPYQDEWLASADTVSVQWSNLGMATIETRLYGIGGVVAGEISGQNLSYQAIYTISLPLVR
jgi:N-acetylneuraminic acid mutarotase